MTLSDLSARLTRQSRSNFYYAFLALPRPRRENEQVALASHVQGRCHGFRGIRHRGYLLPPDAAEAILGAARSALACRRGRRGS